jgi:arylsulfatase A-like enzyme
MTTTSPPNIIILYADDLGFGDIGCYGAETIPTPNLDRLAQTGVKFHQGYASAATCTPSRYSLLTGSYPWRNRRAAILAGDAPLIIEPGSPTLPAMLQDAGYATAVVGKWHLGLGEGVIDWNEEVRPGPNDVGFDEFFIMAATNDRTPTVYLHNGRVVNLDPADPIEVTYKDHPFPGELTGREHPELLRMTPSHGHDGTIINGVSRIGHMRGGEAARWVDETMAETFLDRAVDFVERHQQQPFFLYYAFHQPHVPRLPGPRFQGATPHGPRGDVIVEMDWCVGELLDALERLGLRENTLVIFSSDNGPVLDDGYNDRAVELRDGHHPAGPLRGGKYSMYDGGVRTPFILSWPAAVQPGESDALVSHLDFFASFAALTGQPLPANAAPDSFDVLDALLGRSDSGREELVVEGLQAKTVLRQGHWTYIPPHEGPAVLPHVNIETGNAPGPQLYDLSLDIGQMRNLAPERPEMVSRMAARLEAILRSDRHVTKQVTEGQTTLAQLDFKE